MRIVSKIILLTVLFLSSNLIWTQELYLEITSENINEQKEIDKTQYKKKHQNLISISETVNETSKQFQQKGYLQNHIIKQDRKNDSTYVFTYSLGERTNEISIQVIDEYLLEYLPVELNISDNNFTLKIDKISEVLEQSLKKLEQSGYTLAKLQLQNFRIENSLLKADLISDLNIKRQLQEIVVLGYDKFPKGHLKSIVKEYKKKNFQQSLVYQLYDDFNKIKFVNQLKAPEILFTQDSTKVYVYLEKAKANNFDGYIGFLTNDDGKVEFTGYLDIMLINMFNSGEDFRIYWKNDGNEQQTFDASTELPYIFNSPLAIKANLNIFKQDSTFQNTKTKINLGYYLKYNSRIYLGYDTTESNDISGLNNTILTDFENKFYTANYEYFLNNNSDIIFPEKTHFSLKSGFGERTSDLNNYKQWYTEVKGFYNFYLNQNNIIHLKTEVFYLNSDQYITNELYRFGGINSVRGFNENSLQGNFLSAIMFEYRYILAPTLYINSITDFGYFQDKTTHTQENIYGLGIGLGLLTKNGHFNLVYANGSIQDQAIKLSNSIVHLSFKMYF